MYSMKQLNAMLDDDVATRKRNSSANGNRPHSKPHFKPSQSLKELEKRNFAHLHDVEPSQEWIDYVTNPPKPEDMK